MARGLGRLTSLRVAKATKPGLYADGGGLYLQVRHGEARSWVFRFMLNGKARMMGLGSLNAIGLAEARDLATECRRLRAQGKDPIEVRNATSAAALLDAAKATTFKECGEAYVEAHKAGWRNKKHAKQWEATLKTYAYPIIGALPVQGVDIALVQKVLDPIWRAKPETAGRVRGRIEAILDWATVKKHRQGDNPARWRGNLDKLLPKRSKVRQVQHHPAMPYAELPAFIRDLRRQEGIAPSALAFLILTTTRTGEAIGAKWPEFDLKAAMWTVPATRMKANREHRVPLSPQAVAIIEAMRPVRRNDDFVFPGARKGKPLSNMSLLAVLDRMGHDDVTAHGFRSSFRDWAAERTNYAREVAEACLAHTIGDKVEAAYRRGDLLEKRRRLMTEWAKFCATKPTAKGEVTQLRRV